MNYFCNLPNENGIDYGLFLQNISATVHKEVSNRIQEALAHDVLTRSSTTKETLKSYIAKLGRSQYNSDSVLGEKWIDLIVDQARNGLAFDRYTPKKLVRV